MVTKPTFSKEVSNLLHASHGELLATCIQCGTCSGTCPVADFMDYTPRRLIGMINADMKTNGNILTITVDLAKTAGPSKSGKTLIIAYTIMPPMKKDPIPEQH